MDDGGRIESFVPGRGVALASADAPSPGAEAVTEPNSLAYSETSGFDTTSWDRGRTTNGLREMRGGASPVYASRANASVPEMLSM